VTEPITADVADEAQVEEVPWSPFPDQETAQFHVEKEIRQVQLHDELEKALDRPIQISSASTPGEPGELVWIVPADVDTEVVEKVLEEHVPDPNWGIPQATRDWFDIQRRVLEDPDIELSAQEVQTVLKGLLLRQIGQ
jgi:hypothetical protein